MGLDAGLTAAITLQRQRGGNAACAAGDSIFQLTLANVLLDGGYDGIVTIGEVMQAGDHGLGTVDRLDGELVVVDGVPWRVNSNGETNIVAPETKTPFVVLTTMESPSSARLENVDRDGVTARIEQLVDYPNAVVAVRL